MDYYINGRLSCYPELSKAEVEAEYMAERMKRKVHKKGPAPKLLGNERCQVCGQQANGFHYNVLSCEGCKGFFRRTIINGIEYVCKTGKNECDLYLSGARQRCQKCRILKCLRCGMNPNYVRKRKEHTIVGPYESTSSPVQRPTVIVQMLSHDQESCLQMLSLPWKVVSLTPFQWLDIKETNEVWEYFSCMKAKIIKNFVNKIPTFKLLPDFVQVELIMKSCNELALLLLATLFNKKLKYIQIEDAEIDDSVIYNAFGFDGPVTHKLFHFLNRQADVLHGRDDVALYSILAGLVLFSPDKSSRGIEILQSYQDELYDLLHAYCERYRSIDKSLVTKLMRLMITLKELSTDLKDLSTRRMLELFLPGSQVSKEVNIKQEPQETMEL